MRPDADHGAAHEYALLQSVTARLLGCVRASDTVSRRGGDEFVLLLAELERPDQAGLVADKIIAGGSPYAARFSPGRESTAASFVHRGKKNDRPFRSGSRSVASPQSTKPQRKIPWKDVVTLRGNVERQFVRPMYVGETLLPYRMLKPSSPLCLGTVSNSWTATTIGSQRFQD